MSQVWEVQFPTQSQLLVALKIADYANDQGGSVYPARSTLAKMAQTSESTVKNVLRSFREVGLLIVVREGGHGPKSTTEYQINLRLLNALSRGDCTMIGGSETLQIVWENKEAEFDPLDPERGQSDPVRGQSGEVKGSKLLTPIHQDTHQLETSVARAGACEAGASPARAKLRITPRDVSWDAWMAVLPPDEALGAADAGEFFASARWPGEGVATEIRKRVDITSRMIGEGQ